MPSPIPTDPDPFRRLVQIMAALRAPDGCPWDREQTHQTLKQYMIEEAHEACDAIDRGEDAEIAEELGDVALQVVFHAQLAAEAGRFAIDDVMESICAKLIRRHPHVFGEQQAENASEVLRNWEQIKKSEKSGKEGRSVLEGVPKTLPALQRSQRIQEKASRIGFDWNSAREAFPKVEEELGELREAIESEDPALVSEEMGDLLFALVNYARLTGLRSEELLHKAVDKFESRFRAMERAVTDSGRDISAMTLEEMDAVWDQVKLSGENPEKPSNS